MITELPLTQKDKLAAAEAAIKDLEKTFGPRTVIRLEVGGFCEMPCIPTGIFELDYHVLGIGGFPRGRIVEIFGPESGGKTSMALTAIASVQRTGGLAAFVDAEHALDPTWAATLGVDMSKLLVAQPDTGEEALQIVDRLVDSGGVELVVIDSVAALVPKAELDGEIGDSHVGRQARLMGAACRVLAGKTSRTKTTLLFINQIREKIGVSFGNPETTPGGRALKFYASVRLDVRRIGQIKGAGDKSTDPIGNVTKLKAIKNKVASPFRTCEARLLYGIGFDTLGSVFDAGVAAKMIQKTGAWFSHGGERIGQGRTKALETLVESGGLDLIREELVDRLRRASDA